MFDQQTEPHSECKTVNTTWVLNCHYALCMGLAKHTSNVTGLVEGRLHALQHPNVQIQATVHPEGFSAWHNLPKHLTILTRKLVVTDTDTEDT